MAKIDFKFAINLESFNYENWFKGPLFHKWLPNNEDDAIKLQGFKESIKIDVWFARRGVMRGNEIIYDVNKKEIDPSRISKQYLLSGGYLFGTFEMNDITQEVLDLLTQNLQGNELYVNLGKKIAKMLAPPIIDFVDILRINYGQYWLRPFHNWDSQKQSIGSYCSSILLRWKAKKDQNWQDFIPDIPEERLTGYIWEDKEYFSYLIREDWENLRKLVQTDFKPDLALEILNRAHEEWDNKMYSRAIVDSITALEIAINNKLKKINIGGIFQGQINKFNNQLNLDARIFFIFYDLVPKETILDAIKCKDLRNQIVHNGMRARENDKEKFLSIISCIKALYQEITLKFPSIEAKQTIEN